MQPQLSESKSVIKDKSSYHHGDLRMALIYAVAQKIAQKRSLDFQLRDIGPMVGTSVPAIYRHFASKQDLLVATAIHGYELQKQFRDYALEKTDFSPVHQILGIGFAYVHFSRDFPGFFTLMKNLETELILSSEVYQKQRHITMLSVRTLVVDGLSEGLIAPLELELILGSLQAIAYGVAQLYLVNTMEHVAPVRHNDPKFASELLIQGVRGLLTPKGKAILAQNCKNPFHNGIY